jgi:Flp pilus assembly pilin Flp
MMILRNCSGTTAIEYGFAASLIAVAIYFSIDGLAGELEAGMDLASQAMRQPDRAN